ncbi:unnamed protein product, partial [Rotaria sp. Silwood1]
DIGPNNDCGDDGDSRRGGFRHDAGRKRKTLSRSIQMIM